MSRSYRFYDEDWQRRKSILIRSLFHDIPILSPVSEESNESIDIIQPGAASDVPSIIFDSPSRPYSPLPPLIIEREPNRHDEPEEYYRKLLDKIKKIYNKLFIENIDLSSEDYNLTHYYSSNTEDDLIETDELDHMNVDFNLTGNDLKDNVETDSNDNSIADSFDETNSVGYGADFESNVSSDVIDEEEDEDVNVTYVTNEQELDDSRTPTSKINQETNEKVECTNERFESLETKDTKLHKNIRKDDRQTNSTEESTSSNNDLNKGDGSNIDHEMNDPEESHSERNEEGPYNLSVTYQDEMASDETNNVRNEEQGFVKNAVSKENNSDSVIKERECKSQVMAVTENDLMSVIEEVMEDVRSNVSKEGIDYRQVTTDALIHVDGSQEGTERESRVYEDSVRSIILPTRVKTLKEPQTVDDRIEEYVVLEENEDPETVTTFDTDESESNNGHIEVIRTPRPELSVESMPITGCSDSDVTCEHTAVPQELSNATSLSQDDNDKSNQNISGHQASHDMNDIFNSLINESHPNSPPYEDFTRKRKLYEDMSIQTSEIVSWDDLRANFFVGTPKIFRLCSCDHVCDYFM